MSAMTAMQQAKLDGEILTGLIFIEPETTDLHAMIQTSDTPLNTMDESQLCPGSKALEALNEEFR